MTILEHIEKVQEDLNSMVEQMDNDTDYYDATYHLEQIKEKTEQESKIGHWIKHKHGFWSHVNEKGERDGWIPDYECSLCGSRAWKQAMRYCPNCGAKMESDG